MAGVYPPLLAGGITDQGRYDQFDLYAGESDIVTGQAQMTDAEGAQQFLVLAMVAGRLTAYTGTGLAHAIAAQPVNATTPGTWVPIFTGGVFNHEALVWPAGTNTLALRQQAFAGTNIGVRQLL
jgi:hypothetical protein